MTLEKDKREADVKSGINGRKQIFTGVFMAVLLVFALGCGNKHIDNEAMEEEFENAPEWVLAGHDATLFSAVGSARIGKSGLQFAKTAAMAQARNELSRQLAVKVHALVNSVTRQMGMGDSQTADQMGRQVSRQVTEETLNGSRQEDLWISPSSDLYVLVVMDEDAVKSSVRNQMLSTLKQDREHWDTFQEKSGEFGLDREIYNMF